MKIVVAYSGGLDTSYTVMYLANQGHEIYAACADTGGFSPAQLKKNEENAYKLGIDGVGQAGLEQSLDRYLSGKAGRVLSEIDGKGRALGYGRSEYIAAVNGGSVALTIDASIQSFCEQAAREALRVNNAKAVRVLAMDPSTGEILAMVNKPDFDLNAPPRDDVELLTERLRNRALTDAYEPGSTFKALTAASALDAGLVSVGEGFYCSGSVVVDGGRIRCWGRPHGAETFAQALL